MKSGPCSGAFGPVDFDFDFGLADIIIQLRSVEQMLELDYGELKEWLFVPHEMDEKKKRASTLADKIEQSDM